MKQQRSTLEKRNPLEERKSGDAVGRPSRRSSLLGDPGEKFLGGKLKSSLNSVSTCLKVVDTRRCASRSKRLSACESGANPSGRNFKATKRWSLVSSALYTTPIPPSPSFSTMR